MLTTPRTTKWTIVTIFVLIGMLVCGSLPTFAMMESTPPAPLSRDTFHSYQQMTTILQGIAANHSDIARLYDLGHSVQGRTLWGLKITKNPDIAEDEPEVRICGNHHGNEFMSAEMPLMLAQYITDNYGTDPDITALVDAREIWIIPMVNPDGHEAQTRTNANGVDINRDYGYMWESGWDSPAPFSQPETQAMRANALQHNFVLSLSYHTSGDIINYVWNYKHMSVPDVNVTVQLSNDFAVHNGYEVIDGYDWYQTRGDLNDFSYGCRGDIDWTIEIQDTNIPNAWSKNRDAMLGIIQSADMGLRGIITDASTGQPIDATVYVEGKYWPCFTDAAVGDYHKVLLPGTYTVHFRANGYEEQVISGVTVTADHPTVLDVQLSKGGEYYAHQVTLCSFYDPYSYPNNFQNNPTEGIAALDAPDGSCASLGVNGYIVLDMGTNITDASASNDLTIFEGESTNDGYHVYAALNWSGPWVSLGDGMGTTSFDLQGSGLEKARFVKIVDDGSGSPTESHPGADIDAVQNLAPESSDTPPATPLAPTGPTAGFTFTQYSFQATVPTDPDGTLVYLRWSYGDDTNSEWVGPYTAGTVVSTQHVWTASGSYPVKVKARDVNDSESPYSPPLTISIANQPQLIITKMHGGIGLSVSVRNRGDENLTNVYWSVSASGKLVLYATGTGGHIAALAHNQSATIHTGLIAGFGPVSLAVTVGDASSSPSGLLLGPFLLGVKA